ncbi:type 4a pilus biogenesis protein PilO [Nitrosococcus oceani]|uniref:type 4a pilus biogenesis protein PilO n=1 Tax=Nitrosococcus oceani TaxID=1229 RepID=UPI0004E871B6|nr:type 4a pilus biogenesis protein PilO [Nitrosococcus oceani]KFI23803.1 pilus assembly protein PilO [Nitrosococcus oceani]
MNLSDFNELDFSEIGDWPTVAKAIAVLFIFASVVGGGYWFFTKDEILQLEDFKKKEPELKATFEAKQAKAANLESYEKQMEEMKLSFGTMLRQLPSKTEVADLLVDISQTGLSSGLEFEFFKPSSELPADFYAELPIQIRVIGNYHQFGEFVSKVAALPRIVTLHNFAIENQDKESGKLAMDITAKTYRYFAEDETTAATRN